jgi:hypothetical protein
MATIYFVGGEIGGAGKSTFCMLLIEAFLRWNISYHFRDADRSTPNVGWAYDPENYPKNFPGSSKASIENKDPKAWKPVIFSEDLDDYSQADILIDLARDRDVIVNLPAQVSSSFDIWLTDGGYLDKQDRLGIKFVYFWVAKAEQRSIDLLYANVTKFPKMPHVLVCNQVRGVGEKWTSMLNDDMKTTLTAANIQYIDMPELKLSPTERGLLDRENPRFQDLITEGDSRLSLASSERCDTFINKTLESIKETGLFSSLDTTLKPQKTK